MKQQSKPRYIPYNLRLQRYLEEKQQFLRKNPMASPTELQEAIKRLAHKYRI